MGDEIMNPCQCETCTELLRTKGTMARIVQLCQDYEHDPIQYDVARKVLKIITQDKENNNGQPASTLFDLD